jgi:hypothetical protein
MDDKAARFANKIRRAHKLHAITWLMISLPAADVEVQFRTDRRTRVSSVEWDSPICGNMDMASKFWLR